MCYHKYSHMLYPPMCSTPHDLSELAEYLGLTGIDGDLFYESYYGIDNKGYEEELEQEEWYENYR